MNNKPGFTNPPPGITYLEDSDTRLAGFIAIPHTAPNTTDCNAIRDYQAVFDQKMIDKGWRNPNGTTLHPTHINNVPTPIDVVDPGTETTHTLLWFDHHLPTDDRCHCDPRD